MAIHLTLRDAGRNATSLSFVTSEGSIEVDFDSTRNRSKLPAWAHMLNGRTTEVKNLEGFEGMGTPLHQRHCRRGICFVKPCEGEPLEVDAVWEGQQSTCDRFHPSPHMKAERPSEHGKAGRLDGSQRPIGAVVVVGRRLVESDHGQVLKKRE